MIDPAIVSRFVQADMDVSVARTLLEARRAAMTEAEVSLDGYIDVLRQAREELENATTLDSRNEAIVLEQSDQVIFRGSSIKVAGRLDI